MSDQSLNDKYVVVYVNGTKSYLAKWYGGHYEVVAEGNSAALKKLAAELNETEQ